MIPNGMPGNMIGLPMGPMVGPGLPPLPMYQSVSNDLTIFVGNIPPEVDDSYLFGLFSQIGQIQFCKIMKDFYSGESREFGFISYSSPKSVEAAIKKMNGSKLFGRPLRVMQKKNIKDLNEKANVAVKNIDSAITIGQLSQEFGRFGKVVSCVIRRDESKKDSVGYGFVQFETEEAAANAIEELNNKQMNGKELIVEPFVSPKNRAQPESSNLYFKQFPKDWTQGQVEDFLNTQVSVVGNILSKGVFPKFGSFYAFAAFEKVEDAKKAIEEFNGRKLEESAEPLYVGLALTKYQRAKKLNQEKLQRKNDTNLYVRSIRPEVTREQLRAAFETFGPVTSVLIKNWTPEQKPESEPGKSLQFGFVNFEKDEDALRAQTNYKTSQEIMALLEATDAGKFVFFAQPKRIREQYLRMQRHNSQFLVRNNRQIGQFPLQPHRGRVHRPRGPMPQGMPPGLPRLPNQAHLIPAPLTPQTPPRPITPSEPTQESQILKRMENPTSNVDLVNIVTANMPFFESLPEDKKKKILGHEMFKRVKEKCTDQSFVPKITGMLIDFDVLSVPQMLEIIADDAILAERVEEAISLIDNPDLM